ncbi:MAG: phosphoglycerate dehydrogenase [Deltaproteobacteria bacterium]|nr:phosphoglycerate dehydrogenase [Deltaproteobacteria bacterium]MBW2153107.1 phosphoglycerate dehydrogenase [Deltaproteobacteria bacterium]
MYKVLVTARIFGHVSEDAYNGFKEKGIEVLPNPCKGRALSEDELIEMIDGAHGLLTGVDPVTARVIESARQLKVISKFGAGVDNIDLQAATRKGVIVTNAPGTNSDSVADMAFSLMLAISRRIPLAFDLVRKGEWPLLMGTEIWNKTLGIVGLGNIGKRVALRAKGFNMKVLAYEIAPDEPFVKANDIQLVGLDQLLRESDFISIHTPLTAETRNLMGKEQFAFMKPSAFLVNTARGGIVDEAALYEALKSEKIAGAAFDVLEQEPPKDRKLLGLDNFIVTPHIAAFTAEAIGNMERLSSQNIIDVLEGRIPPHVVNKEVLKLNGL